MLREGEDKCFIDFVTLIEDGYRNLKRLGLETEITTTSSVSVIEKALPADIKRKWSELVSSRDSLVDKSNNFQVFSTFCRVKEVLLNTRVLQSKQQLATHITKAQHTTRGVLQRKRRKIAQNPEQNA